MCNLGYLRRENPLFFMHFSLKQNGNHIITRSILFFHALLLILFVDTILEVFKIAVYALPWDLHDISTVLLMWVSLPSLCFMGYLLGLSSSIANLQEIRTPQSLKLIENCYMSLEQAISSGHGITFQASCLKWHSPSSSFISNFEILNDIENFLF